MTSLVIKEFPEELYGLLKVQARRHHRSMNKEVISLLEAALAPALRATLPPPVGLSKRLTAAALRKAREAGRA